MILSKFVDKLTIIRNIKPIGSLNGMPYYEIRMQQFKQKLHRDLPETIVLGFEGTFPGPVIEAIKNQSIKVKWVNDLPEKHLLPVDTTVHGAEPNKPEVRTVIHLHGGVVRPESDGYPDALFTSSKGIRIRSNPEGSSALSFRWQLMILASRGGYAL